MNNEETPPVIESENPYLELSKEKLLSGKEMFEIRQLKRIDDLIEKYELMIADPESWVDVNGLNETIAELEKQRVEYEQKLELINEAISALEK